MVCLIGGSGRSGTSVLTSMMALHPDVADVPEWRFLIDPDGIVDFYTAAQFWSPYHYNQRLSRLRSLLRRVTAAHPLAKALRVMELRLTGRSRIPFKFSRHYANVAVSEYSPRFPVLVERLIADLTDFRFYGDWVGLPAGLTRHQYYRSPTAHEALRDVLERFLRDVIGDVLAHQGKTQYLEKNTWNILWFDKILELLPDARLVHIHRDPRDVVVSFAQQTWMPSDLDYCARVYIDLLRRWSEVKTRVPERSYLELSLEQLVAEPERTSRDICHFFGLDWSSELLAVDLSHANSGRWKRELNRDRQRELTHLLHENLQELNYEPHACHD